MSLSTYESPEVNYNQRWIERIILDLADKYAIKVAWNRDAAILTGAFAVVGGLFGGYVGGRMAAALGAGIGGVTGYGVSTLVSLREIWTMVKEKLKELYYIVCNFLRRLDPIDYVHAAQVLMRCTSSRRELVLTILDFIAHKLGGKVVSSFTAISNN